MNLEATCDKLADISEDICQLRTNVGDTPIATRLANVQDTISTIRQDVAQQIVG